MRASLLLSALAAVGSLASPLAAPAPVAETQIVPRTLLPVGDWSRGPLADAIKLIQALLAKIGKKPPVSLPKPTPSAFKNWKTFDAYGVNLGGWLAIEKGIDPSFFDKNGASAAIDEDSFCAVLGKFKCGWLLEQRFNNFITFADIDTFAAFGVNTLRVPVGYWAFMPAIKGDNYYTGGQLLQLSKIANYAISKGMHIILDLHGLPGGQNGLDNQGKTGALDWWHNSTHMATTLQVVDRMTTYILLQPRSDQWTLSLINEPLMQGPRYFGQTPESMAYLNEYYTKALKQIRARTAKVPVALSDGFAGEPAWEQWWGNSNQNIVFDTHIYFFVGGSYASNGPYEACYLAKSYQNATNPIFIGEWSIQATDYNTADIATRSLFFQTQAQAYSKYLNGGTFWNGKHFGTAVIGTDGTDQSEYWSFQKLAAEGVIPKPGVAVPVVTCD